MEVKMEPSWKTALEGEFGKEYFKQLAEFVRAEYTHAVVYPPPKNVFRAFDLCPFNNVEVVILGQDPYINAGEANGLCFAVGEGMRLPPSLQNIFKEIESDIGPLKNKSGDLERWARQGVLLLNAVLTVRAGASASHQSKGWEEFTDAVVRALNDQKEHLVFMLWGNYAKQKGAHIDRTKHLVLESPHPSPLARGGFFGHHHFSKANEYLKNHGREPIDWL
ncbi:MAG: uracil-DNA glycosylase [Patescibacteria group bacterium]|nr:uracil-DNA glycosylase [Patescibacteria group bacterium]